MPLIAIWKCNQLLSKVRKDIRFCGGVKCAEYLGELYELRENNEIWLDGKPPLRPEPALVSTQSAAVFDIPVSTITKNVAEEPATAPVAAGNGIWDAEQWAVISAPANARMLVNACPGSGKTAVACARAAYLAEHLGCNPCAMYLLSFTRTAVAEMRQRLESHASSPVAVAGIDVRTLDSFAWQINRGFDENVSMAAGFDASIDAAAQLLPDEPLTAIWLGEIEHMIIDEAQDLVGRRAELFAKLFAMLPASAGITVFCDDAQAIYGYSAQNEGYANSGGATLPDLLRNSKTAYERHELATVYRTATRGLKKLFAETRRDVLASHGSTDYSAICRQIEKRADAFDKSDFDPGSIPDTDNAFVIFRRKRDVLRATAMMPRGRPFRVRIGGVGSALPAWPGAILLGAAGRNVARQEFNDLASDILPVLDGHSLDEAWGILLAVSGSRRVLDLKALRSALGHMPQHSGLLREYLGMAGPIIGTIHSSKGREAETVHLYVPERPPLSDPDYAEECRVIFVGASRPRKSLMVYRTSEEYFASNKNIKRINERSTAAGYRLALGLAGESPAPDDITLEELAGRSLYQDPSEPGSCQRRLRELAVELANNKAPIPLRAVLAGNRYALQDEQERQLCFLSESVTHDWRALACKPPPVLYGIWLMDIATLTTAGVPEASLWLNQAGIYLIPRIFGFSTSWRHDGFPQADT